MLILHSESYSLTCDHKGMIMIKLKENVLVVVGGFLT